jgi:predicted peptidase
MTSLKLLVLALASLGWLGLAARAADPGKRGFVHRVYRDTDGHESKYVVFIPLSYTGDRPDPLILFLHGLGESGADGDKQVRVGLGPAIRKRQKTFDFITVFPQSQKRTWQASSEDGKRAMAILEEVERDYRVDQHREYLTGLSMGGYGTWSLAIQYPDHWAAIAPICCGGNPAKVAAIKDVPCWCFHGAADPTVPVSQSRKMIQALRQAGGDPKYTEYPGVGHNSWDRAYATDALYPWFLQHQRP